MANTVYSNFVLENKLEDQLSTHLDMSQFAVVDASLTEAPGMTKTIHVYTGTGSAQDLTQGNGNTSTCEISYDDKDYTVKVTQARGVYYDEEAMKDPFAVDSLVKYMDEAMINDFRAKIVAEMDNATLVYGSCGWDFDDIVDATAMFPMESAQGGYLLVNKAQVATLRKNLKDSLQYVEAFVRQGYIGTINGFSIYESNLVEAGEAYLGFKEAITVFTKKGIEVEQERDANTRKNTMYSRKVALVALTDATKIVKLQTAEVEEDGD